MEERFPDFVQSEYGSFVDFIESYYEWMEQEGYPVERTSQLLSFRDVDESPEPFLSYLQNEYLSSLPSDFEADKAHLIKNIKAYHRAKGTPKAFKFLFRILYAVDAEIEIPWLKIIKVSAGTWQIDKTIKLTTVFGSDWNKVVGKTITQVGNSGASAIVDRVRQRYEVGTLVTELYLYDIQGTFNTTGRITVDFVENGITKTVYGNPLYNVISSISVTAQGTGYKLGDQLVFTPVCSGTGAKGYISGVDNNGAITGITLSEVGYNYQTAPFITIQTSSGSGATISSTVSTIGTYPGYYIDRDGGFTSSDYIIQDSDYWQRYSYVIETEVGDSLFVRNYKKDVKSAAHPAGMKMYGRLLIDESQDSSQESDTITTSVTSTVIAGISSSSSS